MTKADVILLALVDVVLFLCLLRVYQILYTPLVLPYQTISEPWVPQPWKPNINLVGQDMMWPTKSTHASPKPTQNFINLPVVRENRTPEMNLGDGTTCYITTDSQAYCSNH